MSKPNDQPTEPNVNAAVWFNKRQVARVDFKINHHLGPHQDGWRVDALDDGHLRFTMADGKEDVIPLRSGDYLLSSGEDFYLSLRGDADRRREHEEKLKAKREAREERARSAGEGLPQKGGA